MYVINGIAYAGGQARDISVEAVKPLDDMIMLVTFSSGERRLFDASMLLKYPAFQALKSDVIFKTPRIERGVVTWANGEIDIAPEMMYRDSYEYNELMI